MSENAPAELDESDVSDLRMSDLEPLVGNEVVISDGTNEMTLVLDRLETLRPPPESLKDRVNLRQEPFAMVLNGPAGQHISDGNYWLNFPDVGRYLLYFKAFHADDQGIQYEIILN